MSDDLRLLVLTHLRSGKERRDWLAIDRAYALLGGVGTGDPATITRIAPKAVDRAEQAWRAAGAAKASQPSEKPVSGPVMEPNGWEDCSNVR